MKFIAKHKKAFIIIIAAILVILAVLGGTALAAYLKVRSLLNSTQKIEDVNMPDLENSNLSAETQEEMEGYWNIALFGLDSRDGDLGKGNNSDVEMICSINRATGEIRLVSVYRDTYLKVGAKQYNKINSAYMLGGPSQAISALSENLDLSFDDYASFNWKAVADAINILGGIDIDITADEYKLINGFITETVKSTGIGSHHLTHAGMNHLDGVQAVAYARLRKLDTDFQRTERQRTVLSKALEKARKADFSVINNIMVVVLPEISTSVDMNDVIPMAKNLSRYHLGETRGFPFKHFEKDIGTKDCVIPNTLESNVADLHEFLFDKPYTPSKQVKEISNKIIKDSKGSSGDSTKKKETVQYKTTEETEDIPETLESETAETKDVLHPTGVDGGPGVIVTKPPITQPSDETQGGPGTTTAPSESSTEAASGAVEESTQEPLPSPEEGSEALAEPTAPVPAIASEPAEAPLMEQDDPAAGQPQ